MKYILFGIGTLVFFGMLGWAEWLNARDIRRAQEEERP